jgi:hypothetical protein
MKTAAIGFVAGIVATIAGAYFSGAQQAPAMFFLGVATAASAGAIAIGSRRRMQAAARFLNALAVALGAAAPQPARIDQAKTTKPAIVPSAIERDLISALVNLKASRPAAAAIARQAIAENPAADLPRLLQIATAKARKEAA